MNHHTAVRAVAYLEAFKGLVVLAAASGLLALIHKDLHALAAKLIEHAHLNPASKYPRIFLDAAANIHDARLELLAIGAAAYAAVRLLEAYGLYFERVWAELLAALSAVIYMPIEAYAWWKHPSVFRASVFLVNGAVVACMVWALIQRRRVERTNANE
ncbi:MAG: DUF2127 domain-containing protein [Burkholderiales bacterium]|nr:DUF2127 domain-containing protein [Burkholderiales bacterium]